MKFRTVIVTAVAAALSLAAAASAGAQTLGHPVQRMPASSRQVTGSRLAKGLLSASAIGSGFTKYGSGDSGGRLLSTRVRQTPGSLSCGVFVDTNYSSGWGNTAGAFVIYVNPGSSTNWPFAIYSVSQEVLQFATAHAASAFFNQAYAKYAGCRSFSVPNPTDSTPGGGSYDVSQGSAHKTTVSGHQAFWASELWTPSGNFSFVQNAEVLFALAGTNVYYLWEDSGTNDEPSPALLSHLINRVQALYR